MYEEHLAGYPRAVVAAVAEAGSTAGNQRQVAAARGREGRVGDAAVDGTDVAKGARQGNPGVVVETGIDVAHSQPQTLTEARQKVLGPFHVCLGHVEIAMFIGHQGWPGVGGKGRIGTQAGLVVDRVHRRGHAGGVENGSEISAGVDRVQPRPVARNRIGIEGDAAGIVVEPGIPVAEIGVDALKDPASEAGFALQTVAVVAGKSRHIVEAGGVGTVDEVPRVARQAGVGRNQPVGFEGERRAARGLRPGVANGWRYTGSLLNRGGVFGPD